MVEKPLISVRLNRYVASTGICSRRHADELVFSGRVRLNGCLVTTPATQVKDGDRVTVDKKLVTPLTQKWYLVMNKPCGIITTRHDPQGRLTVIDMLKKGSYSSIAGYLKPVGRLDQNTCGILLLTNDGDLHHNLTHPSRNIYKEYEVVISQPLSISLLKKLRTGINLSDGFIRPDYIDYTKPHSRSQLLVRLHSGKNRIIRRMMEKIGVQVKELRRLRFANIPVSGLKESEVRELTNKEVSFLLEMVTEISEKKKSSKNKTELLNQ